MRRAWVRMAAMGLILGVSGVLWASNRLGAPVRGFRSPGDYPEGLAWDGTHLWSNNFSNGTLYKVDPRDGSIVASYRGGDLPNQPEGLEWDGEFLWTCDWQSGVITKVRPTATGVEVVANYPPPAAAGGTTGLGWDGSNLWLSTHGRDGAKSQLFKLDPQTLEVVQHLQLPVWWVEDLAWDGRYLWSADWLFSIGFAIDPATGDTLHTYRTPGRNPVGQAWDGEHLWISDTTKDSIWALDISRAGTTPVQSISWSGVKSNYR